MESAKIETRSGDKSIFGAEGRQAADPNIYWLKAAGAARET